MTARATQAFHVFDDASYTYRTFAPGDVVPDELAAKVGDHVVDRTGKAPKAEKPADPTPAASEPASEVPGVPGEGQLDADPAPVAKAYDPSAHTVDEVVAYLETASPEESEQVRAAEQAGKARKGILGDED
jgi:trigger factor